MGKPAPKTSALVVSAIRKLREVQGSTSREIMNFITSEYDVPQPTVKRQLQAALKRGLEYGILKCQRGHYSLSTDATVGGTVSTLGEGSVVDKCGKRRKYRKCKKTRRCARGCVPRRRKKSCGKKRRHSRRSKCPKRCKTMDTDQLALDTLDCRTTRGEIDAKRSHHSCRSNRSRTHSRSRTRSRSGRSSAIGQRETSMDRRDKGAE